MRSAMVTEVSCTSDGSEFGNRYKLHGIQCMVMLHAEGCTHVHLVVRCFSLHYSDALAPMIVRLRPTTSADGDAVSSRPAFEVVEENGREALRFTPNDQVIKLLPDPCSCILPPATHDDAVGERVLDKALQTLGDRESLCFAFLGNTNSGKTHTCHNLILYLFRSLTTIIVNAEQAQQAQAEAAERQVLNILFCFRTCAWHDTKNKGPYLCAEEESIDTCWL